MHAPTPEQVGMSAEYPWAVECVSLARGRLQTHPDIPHPDYPTFYEPVVISRPEMVWVHPTARIDSFVKLEGGMGLWIGPWVHVASFGHIGAGGGLTILDEGCTTASHVVVVSGRSDFGQGKYPSAAHPRFSARRWETVIGAHSVLFAGAIVSGKLGDWQLVPAGKFHQYSRRMLP